MDEYCGATTRSGRERLSASYYLVFLGALYSNLALSATMVRSVDDAPRGWYMPVSHSLMVCWRVPSWSAISCWVRPMCSRRARTRLLSHHGGFLVFHGLNGRGNGLTASMLSLPSDVIAIPSLLARRRESARAVLVSPGLLRRFASRNDTSECNWGLSPLPSSRTNPPVSPFGKGGIDE